MELLNALIDNSSIPAITAILLGVLTSISPCPLATNIAAIAYLSKNLKTVKNTLANGIYYALGRAASYTLLAVLIYYGLSSFQISKSVQDWGDKLIGPLLLFIGLAMLNVIKIKLPSGNGQMERIKLWLAGKGSLGVFLLGAIFALAFCPYSAVLYFGALIPLILKSSGGLVLPALFAFGTSFPVIVFSFLIAFSAQKIGKAFQAMQAVEKFTRWAVALIFLVIGAYYLCFLIGV
jgi:sulfite exporter TauE/SafE